MRNVKLKEISTVIAAMIGCACFAGPAALKIQPSVITPNGDGTDDAAAIRYTVPGDKKFNISLTVSNTSGKHIRNVFAGQKKPGDYVAYWNGKDDSGKTASPGTYLVRLGSGLKVELDKSFADNGVFKGFLDPKDVFVTKNGDIYVLDKGEGWIYKIDPAGKGKEELEELGESGNVRMVAVDDNGGLWFTNGAHTIKGPNGNIGGYTPKNPEKGTYWAAGLALGPNNKIYIRNYSGHGLRVFDRTKTGLDGFLYGVTDSDYLQIAPDSASIAVDMKGDIWGTGHTNQVRKVFDTGKKIVFKYALGNKGKKLGQFNKPKGLCYAGGGVLYVADWGNNRIVKVLDNGNEMKAVWQFGAKGDDPAKGLFGAPIDVDVKGDVMFVLTTGKNASLIKYKLKPNVLAEGKVEVK